MADQQKNQGEGNREAARHYNKDQKEFVQSGKVSEKAEEAKRAVEGEEREGLEKAEEKGKSRAKEFDPQVKRP